MRFMMTLRVIAMLVVECVCTVVVAFMGAMVVTRMCTVIMTELSGGKGCDEYCKADEH